MSKRASLMIASSIAADRQVRMDLLSMKNYFYQLPPDELIRQTLELGQGQLSDSGALIISTGEFTGRSPRDRFIVKDAVTADSVDWNNFNIPITSKHFDNILERVKQYFKGLPQFWVRDCYACADPALRLNVRVINEHPWANLFAFNMFLRPDTRELKSFQPEWQIFCAPGLHLDPEQCGTRQKNAAVISFVHKTIIIAGTGYTGEIKKSLFTVLNFLMPHLHDVLSMHCSANVGDKGDTALFFGLSGTGKTTLSADCERTLIGDDEHGWTKNNIFNFEGGCYAKVVDLSEEKEPEIFHAIKEGALLENTICYPGTNKTDFASTCITENTRVSYPIEFVRNVRTPSVGNVPSNIFFLTCDAYGVLPPISRLTKEQAMYHFISGYTAKIAGTEEGVKEPVSTFSACFGAPFIPLHAGTYAKMLGERLQKTRASVWLINTGWTGGPIGVGTRMKLEYTRTMIRAAIAGKLNNIPFDKHPVYNFDVPSSCPGVPGSMLYPRDTWVDKEAYDEQAVILAKKFVKNFEKFADGVDSNILSAAPSVT